MGRPSDHERDRPLTSDSDADRGDWERRRRLSEVFGADLPEQTTDDRDEGHTGLSQDWYESNRPPHHE